MRNLNFAVLSLLLIACHTPETPIAGMAPDMTKTGDMTPTSYDGTYDCKRDTYRDVSCSPMFFVDHYQIRVSGNKVEFVGEGMCQGQWQGAHFSCPVAQFDPTCGDATAFTIDVNPDGTVIAGIPSDGAASGHCTKQ
jgi:hypothetical protein